jgi:hypothetical protein
MLILASTSDILRVVTDTAVSTVGVHASWADNASGTVTPGRTNTAITTATTTTIVAAPASSTYRNIRTVRFSNNNTSQAVGLTIQHYDGTTSIDIASILLGPLETALLLENGELIHKDSQGGTYSSEIRNLDRAHRAGALAPSGYLSESFPRLIGGANATFLATSGTMYMQALYGKAGWAITKLAYWAAGASATQTNAWLALYDSSRNLLRQSTTRGSTVVASSTMWEETITSTTLTYSGLYYIGVMQQASTRSASVHVVTSATGFRGVAPIICGSSDASLTTTAPSTAAAITATTVGAYVAMG